MEPQALVGFIIVALTLTCIPGPDWAFAITAGLCRRSYMPAVAGMCSGYLLHTALLAAGIAALMAALPALLLWLTVAGALYLIWLGVKTTRSWRAAGFVMVGPNGELPHGTAGIAATGAGVPVTGAGAGAAAGDPEPLRGLFWLGFGTSAINPKGMLLFLALTPQFIHADAAFPVPLQSVILGMSFVLSTAVVYTIVAGGARRLLRSRPGAARGLTLSSGIIMCVLGAALLVEQIEPVGVAAGQLLASL